MIVEDGLERSKSIVSMLGHRLPPACYSGKAGMRGEPVGTTADVKPDCLASYLPARGSRITK